MKRLALAVVAALTVAGCGSTVQVRGSAASAGSTTDGLGVQSGSVPGTSTEGGAVPGATAQAPTSPAGRAPGVGPGAPNGVRPTGTPAGAAPVLGAPLKLGVLYSDNGAANAALGVATAANNDPKSVVAALVAALNTRGGLAGRKLVPTYYAVDGNASDYSTQANSACSYFTQDHPVPVVLDLAYGNKFGMATCLAGKGVVDVGIRTSDSVADNQVGLFAAPSWLSSTVRYPAVLTGLHAAGYLTAKNKVGVLLEDCPDLQRAFEQAVKPTIARLGVDLVDTEHIACTTGFTSAGPASAAVQSAALRFRTSGADRLLMVSDFEQVTLLLLANYAESQGWRPGFMLSSQAQTEVMRANIASGQWPQLHGIGWSPGLDIDDPRQPLPAEDKHCLDLVRQGGVTVSGWQNTYVATTACTEILFLGAALQRSDGDATGRALMAGVDRLGSSFTAPGLVSGRTSFGPARRGGPAAAAPFAFVASCSCLRYVGAPSPVG